MRDAIRVSGPIFLGLTPGAGAFGFFDLTQCGDRPER
jgi:hypothetical protein